MFLSNNLKAAAKAKNKCQDEITDRFILLHDSACPHVAHTLHIQPKAMKLEVLKHGAYSPALLPWNFHAWDLERRPKDVLSHQMSVQEAVGQW